MRYTATLSKAHNYVRIFDYYGEFTAKVILPFCKAHLFKWGKVPVPGTREQAWKVTHVFARSNHDQSEYRLPAELMKEFIQFAVHRGYNEARLKITEEPEIVGHPCVFELNPEFANPREEQEEWIEYQLAPGAIKVNNAATGVGKTYMGLYTAFKLGTRTLITVQPRYVTTWLNDIAKTLKLKPEDVVVWENSSLPLLGEQIKNGVIDPKIVILPITRISAYLRASKDDPNMPTLDEIYGNIGAGYRIIDEGHESFHELCLSMLYGNFPKMLVLSATLKSDDAFQNKMYQTMLPIRYRLKEAEAENYIDVVAYLYELCQHKYRLNFVQFGSYNDLALEASVLKKAPITNFYYQIAKKTFEEYYLNVREEGTKCLFFFSRIDMALKMLELFKADYPNLDVETFLGTLDKKTPEKYLHHEVIITTPGSCGTGKDIPGLVTTICFHTVFSDQRNKQMIGRLRQLRGKFGGRITPTFVFPVCKDLPKHRECFDKRKLSFNNKQKSFKLIESNLALT